MAVDIDVTYRGGLVCEAVHGPSGARIETTPPVDNGGDGSKFSPTDLAATAFAVCVTTIMAMAAERRGVDVTGTRARVEKHMTSEGPRRIDRLPLVVDIPIEVGDEDRQAIEEAARGCPVCKSLSAEVKTPVTFRWGRPAPARSSVA